MNGKELGKEGNAVREKSSIMLKGKIANHNQGDDKEDKDAPREDGNGVDNDSQSRPIYPPMIPPSSPQKLIKPIRLPTHRSDHHLSLKSSWQHPLPTPLPLLTST